MANMQRRRRRRHVLIRYKSLRIRVLSLCQVADTGISGEELATDIRERESETDRQTDRKLETERDRDRGRERQKD